MAIEWMEKKVSRGCPTPKATIYHQNNCPVLRLNACLVNKYRLQNWERISIGYDEQTKKIYIKQSDNTAGLLLSYSRKKNGLRQISLKNAIRHLRMKVTKNYSAECLTADNILILVPQDFCS